MCTYHMQICRFHLFNPGNVDYKLHLQMTASTVWEKGWLDSMTLSIIQIQLQEILLTENIRRKMLPVS